MTATYTWDVFSTLDGYGSFGPGADWGGYWSKQGPELLAHRAAQFAAEQRMVFGATTFRETAEIFATAIDPLTLDEWNQRTLRAPATVISSTLKDTLGWPDATIVSGDAAAPKSWSTARRRIGIGFESLAKPGLAAYAPPTGVPRPFLPAGSPWTPLL